MRGTQILLMTFYGLAVIAHLLNLTKVIPFDWVSGGRSTTYGDQAVQSSASIVAIGLLSALKAS